MRKTTSKNSTRSKRRTRSKLGSSHAVRGIGKSLHLEPLETRLLLSVTPQLVDLNPAGASNPSDFVQIGNVAFFVAEDDTNGRELWSTDGTPEGTSLVKDIRDGSDPSNPGSLVEFDGELYFAADDGINGRELWKSDGTVAGTAMVYDINPGEGYQYPYGSGPLQSFPRQLTVVGGELFFGAEDATHGGELWKTDGTAAGTTRVKDIFPGTFTDSRGTYPSSSSPWNLVDVDGTLFFTAADADHGVELWKSNGTEAGTVLVEDINPDTDPNAAGPDKLTAVDGQLFFIADDGTHGTELWKSNGSEANTALVKDINPGVASSMTAGSPVAAVGGRLLFGADDGVHGDELWSSDGLEAGTNLLKDIHPGSEGNLSRYPGFTEVDGTLFFSARDDTHGRELWKSDGTQGGTVLIRDINVGSNPDGTPSYSYPYFMHAVDGTLYFSAAWESTGRELWQSDGTAEGTSLVDDTVTGSNGLLPVTLGSINGTLVLSGAEGSGGELWMLDTRAVEVDSARLTVFVDGQQIAIPANVGVYANGSKADVHTTDGTGQLVLDTANPATLGDFLDVWRTDAGLAGNNPNATLSADELFGNVADTTSTVQMFVNGRISTELGGHLLDVDDQVVLVYSSNPVLSINTNYGPIVIELFEDEVGVTVDNFLNYVDDEDYLDTIFHRSDVDRNFVIQGGGFDTTSTTFSDLTQFGAIPTDDPIVNESERSNLRGTVGVARSSALDSATSQFYVNLADNLGFDPSSAGAHDGYTVFGQVLGMTTVDAIADLPIDRSNGSPFADLPYSSHYELVVVESLEGQGRLTGVKFRDDNRNGAQDAGEPGIAGVTVFLDTNGNGTADGSETATTTDADGRFLIQVEPGTYTLRADVSAGSEATVPVNPESYTVIVQIGRELDELDFGEAAIVIDPPGSIDLVASADSGNDEDDRTNFNNSTAATALRFEVDGVTDGAEVRIYSDGVQIGSGTASGSVATVTTNGSTALFDGDRQITATQVVLGNASDPSAALTVTIDTAPPAPIASTAPDLARAGQLYAFDADSPDEGQAGVEYSLAGKPNGMTINRTTGLINWTPTDAQVGPETFDILVGDAVGNVSSQTVDLTVIGAIPAIPDEYWGDEDTPLVIDALEGVLDNDGDANSGVLSAAVVDEPTDGTVELNPDGSFTYTPDDDFFGTDSFTYIASNANDDSNVAEVTIHVAAVNDAPETTIDGYAATEDVILQIDADHGVLANDRDADGDTLTATLADQAVHGVVALALDGSFSYTPNGQYSGPDSFTYTASDGQVTSDPVTVTLTVAEVLDPPTAVADGYSVDEDDTLTRDATLGLLANDTDPDSTSLTATLHTQAAHGTATVEPDGSFSYTPDGDYFGGDSFTYIASDGDSDSNVAQVTIDVAAVSDDPQPAVDGYAVTENVVLAIDAEHGVLANDRDADGDTLTATLADQAEHGVVALAPDGSFSYTPNGQYSGPDSFTYTASDGQVTSDPVTVTLTVAEVLDPPTAVADGYSVDEDDTLTRDATLGLLANDTDPDSTSLTATLHTQAAHGTATIEPDGSFSYTPDDDYFGGDSFTYIASDGDNDSNVAQVTITVNNRPDPPTATGDQRSAPNDGTVQTFEVLGNDTSDPDPAQTLSIKSVTQGTAGGTVDISGNAILYSAPLGYVGTDTFTYTIEDTDGLTDTATVTVAVLDTSDSTLAGFVYIDRNNNAVKEAAEQPLANATVSLVGIDSSGDPVSRTTTTDALGFYQFIELPIGTYSIVEAQPTAYLPGKAAPGSLGGIASADGNVISGVVIGTGGQDGQSYNFGETRLRPELVSLRGLLFPFGWWDTTDQHDGSGETDPAVLAAQEEVLASGEAVAQGVATATAVSGPIATAGDDTLVYDARTGEATLTSGDGRVETFISKTLQFDTLGGNDTVTIIGTEGSDTLSLGPNTASLAGQGYAVTIVGAEQITVDGLGGQDTATISDSPGNDEFRAGPGKAWLIGEGFYHHLLNFENQAADGSSGGFDIAYFYDSKHDDTYTATPASAVLEGPGFELRADDFEAVHAYATAGGRDEARLYDSVGNDLFIGAKSESMLYGDGYYNRAKFFEAVGAFAGDGVDEARLFDSTGDDTFEASPAEATLHGVGFSNRANAFDVVHGYSTMGGNDTALLTGSAGDDHLMAHDVATHLWGDGYYIRAKLFEQAYADGGQGNDTAELRDSSGNDTLSAGLNWLAIDWGTSGLLGIQDFDSASARSSQGGDDRSDITATNVDYLLSLSGPWEP